MRVVFSAICLVSAMWFATTTVYAQQSDSKDNPPSPVLLRAQQVIALSSSKEADAVARIKEALSDESWYVRGEAARTLGKVRDKSAEPLLLRLLKDESWFVRFAALEAIDSLGVTTDVQPIRETFASPDEYTRARG